MTEKLIHDGTLRLFFEAGDQVIGVQRGGEMFYLPRRAFACLHDQVSALNATFDRGLLSVWCDCGYKLTGEDLARVAIRNGDVLRMLSKAVAG